MALFFRSRKYLLRQQLLQHLSLVFGIESRAKSDRWFLSTNSVDSTFDREQDIIPGDLLARAQRLVEAGRQTALFAFMMDDSVRSQSVERFSNERIELLGRIERRRSRWSAESIDLRRRALSAVRFDENQNSVLLAMRELGIDPAALIQGDGRLMREMMEEVSLFFIERELTLKLEQESRQATENDLRDFMSYLTVLPFATHIFGEKAFIELIRQCGLDRKFGASLFKKLTAVSIEEVAAGSGADHA